MLEGEAYKLKILFKLSETGYKHTKLHLIHGSRQGAINSPGLWMFISSNYLIVMMTKQIDLLFVAR